MSEQRFSSTPDLMWNSNNGVVFIVPLPGGHLERLVKRTKDGDLTGWCFASDEIRDSFPGWYEYTLGNGQAGLEFISSLAAQGLVLAHVTNLNVPYSMGRRRSGQYAEDYLPSEHAVVRSRCWLPDWLTLMYNESHAETLFVTFVETFRVACRKTVNFEKFVHKA